MLMGWNGEGGQVSFAMVQVMVQSIVFEGVIGDDQFAVSEELPN